MTDVQIRTELMQSEANGKFQRMQEIKRQRETLKAEYDKLQEGLIKHIEKNGNVMAYKDDLPHILTVGRRTSTKLDKAGLAAELELAQKELTTVHMVELVEKGKLSAQMIESHQYQESVVTLKVRKASKNDLSLIFGK